MSSAEGSLSVNPKYEPCTVNSEFLANSNEVISLNIGERVCIYT